MEKKGRCVQCGKDKKLIGRGLCCACYHRERRMRGAQADGGDAGKVKFIVPVDFAPMAYLLEELRKRAGSELRDVGRQILWELNKSVGANAHDSKRLAGC
jgi:hypothetical protein